jgi:hypothetical protein
MKNKFLLSLLPLLLLLLTGCEKGEFGPWVRGVGPVESEDRSVGSFSRLEAQDHIDVVLTQGPTAALRLEGQRNILDLVEARVSGDQLVLRLTRPTRGKQTKRVQAYLTVPDLAEVNVEDHATVRSAATWSAGTFRLRVKDHGAAELNLSQTDKLVTFAKDHASVQLAGTVGRHELSGTGHAAVRAFDLRSQDAQVTADDHAAAELLVTGQLQAEARDHAHVAYRGRPATTVRASGHAQVTAAE